MAELTLSSRVRGLAPGRGNGSRPECHHGPAAFFVRRRHPPRRYRSQAPCHPAPGSGMAPYQHVEWRPVPYRLHAASVRRPTAADGVRPNVHALTQPLRREDPSAPTRGPLPLRPHLLSNFPLAPRKALWPRWLCTPTYCLSPGLRSTPLRTACEQRHGWSCSTSEGRQLPHRNLFVIWTGHGGSTVWLLWPSDPK